MIENFVIPRLKPYLSNQMNLCTRLHTRLLLNELSATKPTEEN